VAIALDAQSNLAAAGIAAAVVSVPCLDLFAAQSDAYRDAVLGTAPRIVIEAGIRQGWDWLLRSNDHFIGMTGFGASAPIDDLYQHFGITADAAIAAATSLIKNR
jgi:transketolase